MSIPSRLTEEAIRPAALMKEHPQFKEADRNFLLSKIKDFVEVPCPACKNSASYFLFDKQGFKYRECQVCATAYISPRPSPEILEEFYAVSENYAYWNKVLFPASENARREKIFKPRAERVIQFCRKYIPGGKSLLEIGSGYGTFCEEVRKINYFERVIAVEPTKELSKTCRQKGLEIIPLPIEKVKLDDEGKVDTIVSFEVIEHVFDPQNFIQFSLTNLKENGLLILTCPNFHGFDIQILKEHAPSVDYEHLNYFHPKSLTALLHKMGFDVIEVVTPGELDVQIVRRVILSGVANLDGQPFLKKIIIDGDELLREKFQDFLKSSGSSSHMWIVARKK